MLIKGVFKVKEASFEREYLKSRLPECEVMSLGKYLNAILILRSQIKK
jgi:hypothetical protein